MLLSVSVLVGSIAGVIYGVVLLCTFRYRRKRKLVGLGIVVVCVMVMTLGIKMTGEIVKRNAQSTSQQIAVEEEKIQGLDLSVEKEGILNKNYLIGLKGLNEVSSQVSESLKKENVTIVVSSYFKVSGGKIYVDYRNPQEIKDYITKNLVQAKAQIAVGKIKTKFKADQKKIKQFMKENNLSTLSGKIIQLEGLTVWPEWWGWDAGEKPVKTLVELKIEKMGEEKVYFVLGGCQLDYKAGQTFPIRYYDGRLYVNKLAKTGLFGEHQLGKGEDSLLFFSLDKEISTNMKLQFNWESKPGEIVCTTLPYSKFRFIIDESKDIPTAEFIFNKKHVPWCLPGTDLNKKGNESDFSGINLNDWIMDGKCLKVAVVRISTEALEKETHLPKPGSRNLNNNIE